MYSFIRSATYILTAILLNACATSALNQSIENDIQMTHEKITQVGIIQNATPQYENALLFIGETQNYIVDSKENRETYKTIFSSAVLKTYLSLAGNFGMTDDIYIQMTNKNHLKRFALQINFHKKNALTLQEQEELAKFNFECNAEFGSINCNKSIPSDIQFASANFPDTVQIPSNLTLNIHTQPSTAKTIGKRSLLPLAVTYDIVTAPLLPIVMLAEIMHNLGKNHR